MTGKERIEAALKGTWPDKRPIMLHNFMLAARVHGLTMKQYRENPRDAAEAHISFVERYDLDAVFIDVDTCTTAGAVGVPIDYPEDEPARVSGSQLLQLADVDHLEPVDISKDRYVQNWLEICCLVKEHFGDEKCVRGNCDQAPFSLASMMRGTINFMMDLPSGDERIFRLLEYCQDACFQFIDLMSQTGVDMVSNGDSPAGPDMISPQMYRTFALPYETSLVKRAHEILFSIPCWKRRVMLLSWISKPTQKSSFLHARIK